MDPGVKADRTAATGGSQFWKICITCLCLLSISSSNVRVTGFALRHCRISNKVAECNKSQLRAVPRDIPSTVRGFDLSKNKISRIQISDFKNLLVLSELYLSSNNISQIDNGAFSSLISLKELHLNKNKLVSLGEDLFDGLVNLTLLKLQQNSIKTVAFNSFKPLRSLKILDISYNKLLQTKQLQSALELRDLRELYITNNNLMTFQSWELTNRSLGLTFLNLSWNPITVFQITADVFPKLVSFSIGGSQDKQMVWDVQNKSFLHTVSTLDISGLQMAFDDMKTLLQTVNASLKSLKMNYMKSNLKELINVSCTIPTLSTLQIRFNRLKCVSSDMFNLCIHVTELDLLNNQLHIIQDDAFRPLQSLRILSLSYNKLSSVPAATRNLPALEELNLINNKIKTLKCDDFANQTKLRHLSLYQNSISALQECLFKDLIQLQVLKLQSNHITKLNGTFTNYFPNLRELSLDLNKLTTLHNGEFRGLRSLQTLSLHDNQIRNLERLCFIGLTNLTDILMQKNQITENEINKGVFNKLINLRSLDIRENHIKYVDSSALSDPPFSQLARLETLAVPSQHRREKSYLPRNFLQGLTNLLVFNTRDIQLLSLHEDTFVYTPLLQKLDISSNDLKDLSASLFSPIQNLKSLYISRTSLRSLDFLIDANLTQLEFLQARENQYYVISKEVINSLPALVYVDFQGNSFFCDCNNAQFLQWVENSTQTQVYDAYNFICNYPPNLIGGKLLDLDVRSCSVDTDFICFVSTTCTILLFMVVSFTYNFLMWQLAYAYYLFLALLADRKHKNKQDRNQYDAFISYNIHDESWVITELLPKLEEEQGWRLCLHHRDFEPGKPIIDNITDAIYGSRKTICVISRTYLESEWCSREIQVASFRLFDENKDVLILVFLEEIPMFMLSPYYRMRKLLKRKTYLSWPRAGERTEVFWKRLHQALKTNEDLGKDQLLHTAGD